MAGNTEYTTLSLAEIDTDGALRETAGRLPTRGQFLRLGGGVALGGLALGLVPGVAGARERHSDQVILNFALALEYLQAAFYTEAERVGALHGGLADQARVVGSHERAHVRAFRSVLGSAAIKSPRFNFHGATDSPGSFRAAAVAFEDLAVAAYKEQLPKISSNAYLATAVSIHSVEARHASWIRRLAGIVPAPNAFDEPSPDRRTVRIVNSTHFVTLHVPKTSTRHAPAFTG
jgi:rubrerythrin